MAADIPLRPSTTQNIFTVNEDGSATLVWNGNYSGGMTHVDELQLHLYSLLCRAFGSTAKKEDDERYGTLSANIAFLARQKLRNEIEAHNITALRTNVHSPERGWVVEHRIAIVFREKGKVSSVVSARNKDPGALLGKLKQAVDTEVNEILYSD
ncbi:hypothetical protein CC80DRAFT_598607 [Byssothecium circinans]|uniref:Uncharacterized protein n=1 Tax=Byssothecium circinans TaxID=147558 RepID=A0A6A5TDW1_9PLEO|nr:hypothetical protein CC80DRAFT_598607 [Byssothecium circinans]